MDTPTNILYVIPRPEIGGAERQLLMLMRGLDRSRFRPHVVCLDGVGSLLSDYEEAAERVYVLDRHRAFDIGALAELIRIIRHIRPEIVHTWLYIANLYGGWAARLAGASALVVSQRGLGIDPQHTRLKTYQMRVFNLLIAQFADRLLANAEAVARPMWRAGFAPERTRVVYNGLEPLPDITEAKRRALRQEFQVRDGQILLGSIARIDPKKDLGTMLRAVALVAQKHPHVRLLLVGGGFPHYQRELECLASDLGIQAHVEFLGFRSDPLEILSLCQISLLSSVTEGLPNAILESMLLGKPIVATRVGGVPELIGDGVEGWLVPPGDPNRFADQILHLIENPDRAEQMGAAGHARALRDFSAEAMVRRTEAVYDELLSDDGPPTTDHVQTTGDRGRETGGSAVPQFYPGISNRTAIVQNTPSSVVRRPSSVVRAPEHDRQSRIINLKFEI